MLRQYLTDELEVWPPLEWAFYNGYYELLPLSTLCVYVHIGNSNLIIALGLVVVVPVSVGVDYAIFATRLISTCYFETTPSIFVYIVLYRNTVGVGGCVRVCGRVWF